MKKLLTLAAVLLFFAFVSPVLAAQYKNARFEFQVDVPEDFEWMPEPANGDGRIFQHKRGDGVKIHFYARNQLDDDDTLPLEGNYHIPEGAENVKEHMSDRMYRVTFKLGETYQKITVSLVDEVFHTGTAKCPIAEYEKFKPVFADIFRSWKIHGNSAVIDEEAGR